MMRAVLPIVAESQGRGVYRAARKVQGRWPYYAVSSTGEVIEAMRPRHYETDAEVVVTLADRLDAVDPPAPRLALVRNDAPSGGSPVSAPGRFWMHGLRPLVREPARSPHR